MKLNIEEFEDLVEARWHIPLASRLQHGAAHWARVRTAVCLFRFGRYAPCAPEAPHHETLETTTQTVLS